MSFRLAPEGHAAVRSARTGDAAPAAAAATRQRAEPSHRALVRLPYGEGREARQRQRGAAARGCAQEGRGGVAPPAADAERAQRLVPAGPRRLREARCGAVHRQCSVYAGYEHAAVVHQCQPRGRRGELHGVPEAEALGLQRDELRPEGCQQQRPARRHDHRHGRAAPATQARARHGPEEVPPPGQGAAGGGVRWAAGPDTHLPRTGRDQCSPVRQHCLHGAPVHGQHRGLG
mmetsp:Transcript_29374/g.82762  ORF Transcript_29374/g.82762 Transcript_29374/m.82762 type:complete len:232 (-) Transcript_29374:1085-1780(-)